MYRVKICMYEIYEKMIRCRSAYRTNSTNKKSFSPINYLRYFFYDEDDAKRDIFISFKILRYHE